MKANCQNDLTVIQSVNKLNLSGKAMHELIMEFMKQGICIKIKAKGNSMFPFIKDGDILTIAPYKDINPELGDISAFFNPITNRMTIHRLVGRNNNKYLAKGDCCFCNDGYQMRSGLIGYVSDIVNTSFRTKLIRHPKIKKIIRLLSIINVTYYSGTIWKCIRPDKKPNEIELYSIIICLNTLNLMHILA